MPRHPEGQVALTQAERQARLRKRQAAAEKRRLEALRSIANDPRVPAQARAVARAAIEGKPQ